MLGVEVEKVQEVIRYLPMTRVPLAGRTIGGLINLRGQIVTAIDLRRQLAFADRPDGVFPMNIVIATEEGPTSLLVDEIGDVLELDASFHEPPPDTMRGPARQFISGAFKLPDRLMLTINTENAIHAVA